MGQPVDLGRRLYRVSGPQQMRATPTRESESPRELAGEGAGSLVLAIVPTDDGELVIPCGQLLTQPVLLNKLAQNPRESAPSGSGATEV